MYWPFLSEIVEKQITPGVQTEAERADWMSEAKDQPTPDIEESIEKTYEERPATRTSMTDQAASVSMMERPETLSSIGAISPPVTPTPVPSAAGIDLKSEVEAISVDGIYIEQLQEADDGLTIIGYADDNKTIANYLRQLQQRIGNPLLNMAKREELQGKTVSKFSIRLRK